MNPNNLIIAVAVMFVVNSPFAALFYWIFAADGGTVFNHLSSLAVGELHALI